MDTAVSTAKWPDDGLSAASAPSGAVCPCAGVPPAAATGGMLYARLLTGVVTYPAPPRGAAVPWPGRAKPRLEPRPLLPPPQGAMVRVSTRKESRDSVEKGK